VNASLYSYTDEIPLDGLGRGMEVILRAPFRKIIDNCHRQANPYRFFELKKGEVVKKERRTRLVLWKTPDHVFYFKHYFYPGSSRLKTFGGIPKAKREYLTLGFLKHLGIPCVEAAGWGACRGRWGGVLKCFILTVREENTVNFRTWLRHATPNPRFRPQTENIVKSLGRYIRRLHDHRFFLLRPNTRNILIRHQGNEEPKVLFLDQPYARFLRGPGAVWGQMKDLSTLLGGAMRHLEETVIDTFLEGYLPNPLDNTPEDLRRRLMYAIRARESDQRLVEWWCQLRAICPVLMKRKKLPG